MNETQQASFWPDQAWFVFHHHFQFSPKNAITKDIPARFSKRQKLIRGSYTKGGVFFLLRNLATLPRENWSHANGLARNRLRALWETFCPNKCLKNGASAEKLAFLLADFTLLIKPQIKAKAINHAGSPECLLIPVWENKSAMSKKSQIVLSTGMPAPGPWSLLRKIGLPSCFNCITQIVSSNGKKYHPTRLWALFWNVKCFWKYMDLIWKYFLECVLSYIYINCITPVKRNLCICVERNITLTNYEISCIIWGSKLLFQFSIILRIGFLVFICF